MQEANAPTGVGIYVRQLARSVCGAPDELARKLREHGVTWVAFMACWQDVAGAKPVQRVPDPLTLAAYAKACARQGVAVWLWGYPWAGREEAFVEAMRGATLAAGVPVAGWLLDPEKPYLGKPAAATKLIELARDESARLKLGPLGVTSYGVASFHPTMPFAALAAGSSWGSPQLYTVDDSLVPKGMESWRAAGWARVVPSVPSYGENSGHDLDAYLESFGDIDGFIVWSLNQMDGREWAVLAKWAKRFAAKACLPDAPTAAR